MNIFSSKNLQKFNLIFFLTLITLSFSKKTFSQSSKLGNAFDHSYPNPSNLIGDLENPKEDFINLEKTDANTEIASESLFPNFNDFLRAVEKKVENKSMLKKISSMLSFEDIAVKESKINDEFYNISDELISSGEFYDSLLKLKKNLNTSEFSFSTVNKLTSFKDYKNKTKQNAKEKLNNIKLKIIKVYKSILSIFNLRKNINKKSFAENFTSSYKSTSSKIMLSWFLKFLNDAIQDIENDIYSNTWMFSRGISEIDNIPFAEVELLKKTINKNKAIKKFIKIPETISQLINSIFARIQQVLKNTSEIDPILKVLEKELANYFPQTYPALKFLFLENMFSTVTAESTANNQIDLCNSLINLGTFSINNFDVIF